MYSMRSSKLYLAGLAALSFALPLKAVAEEDGFKFLKRELICTHVDGAKYNINFRENMAFFTRRESGTADFKQDMRINRNDFQGKEWLSLAYGQPHYAKGDGSAATYRIDRVSDDTIIFALGRVEFGKNRKNHKRHAIREYSVRLTLKNDAMSINCKSSVYPMASLTERSDEALSGPKNCTAKMRGNGIKFKSHNIKLRCKLH